jgi:urease beta subunit
MHLNIPAGTAVRFEPGEERQVELVAFGGSRDIHGFNALVNGQVDDPDVLREAMTRIRGLQFGEESR